MTRIEAARSNWKQKRWFEYHIMSVYQWPMVILTIPYTSSTLRLANGRTNERVWDSECSPPTKPPWINGHGIKSSVDRSRLWSMVAGRLLGCAYNKYLHAGIMQRNTDVHTH